MSLDFCLDIEACPTCGRGECVLDVNITHNLNKMAQAAGIYEALWRPDENGLTRAINITNKLEEGLRRLKESPDKFRKLDSPNGWGTYDNFVPFVEEVLAACKANPMAVISVSR